jgi:hypothetical protein
MPITSIVNPTTVETGISTDEIAQDFVVTISNSEDGVNDGKYDLVETDIPTTEISFKARETSISDQLMPINTLSECMSCKLSNPYSYIMTVVMPAWQGRFANQDFRTFFDRSFRLECPAHLVPNICWVNCEQMFELEKVYKKWLIENSKQHKNPLTLSTALNELIDVLDGLRSIYPAGTLHDCNIDNTVDNAIILNKTEIGTN